MYFVQQSVYIMCTLSTTAAKFWSSNPQIYQWLVPCNPLSGGEACLPTNPLAVYPDVSFSVYYMSVERKLSWPAYSTNITSWHSLDRQLFHVWTKWRRICPYMEWFLPLWRWCQLVMLSLWLRPPHGICSLLLIDTRNDTTPILVLHVITPREWLAMGIGDYAIYGMIY